MKNLADLTAASAPLPAFDSLHALLDVVGRRFTPKPQRHSPWAEESSRKGFEHCPHRIDLKFLNSKAASSAFLSHSPQYYTIQNAAVVVFAFTHLCHPPHPTQHPFAILHTRSIPKPDQCQVVLSASQCVPTAVQLPLWPCTENQTYTITSSRKKHSKQ